MSAIHTDLAQKGRVSSTRKSEVEEAKDKMERERGDWRTLTLQDARVLALEVLGRVPHPDSLASVVVLVVVLPLGIVDAERRVILEERGGQNVRRRA